MNPLFQSHFLNGDGRRKAIQISNHFANLLMSLEELCDSTGYRNVDTLINSGNAFYEMKSHLEIAAFYAKKAMASLDINQEPPRTHGGKNE